MARNNRKPNEYEKIQYLDGLKPFVTDKNLVELFTSIGYPNIDKRRYSDLFFTNISLGYRTINTSARITKAEISTDKEIVFKNKIPYGNLSSHFHQFDKDKLHSRPIFEP